MVEEEELAGGLEDTLDKDGNDTDTAEDDEQVTETYTFDLSALVDFGADGPGGFYWSDTAAADLATDNSGLTSGEETVYFAAVTINEGESDEETLIVGYIDPDSESDPEQNTDNWVLTYQLDADSEESTLTLIKPIDHGEAAAGAENEESYELDLTRAIYAMDNDGDMVTFDSTDENSSTVKAYVIDDTPLLQDFVATSGSPGAGWNSVSWTPEGFVEQDFQFDGGADGGSLSLSGIEDGRNADAFEVLGVDLDNSDYNSDATEYYGRDDQGGLLFTISLSETPDGALSDDDSTWWYQFDSDTSPPLNLFELDFSEGFESGSPTSRIILETISEEDAYEAVFDAKANGDLAADDGLNVNNVGVGFKDADGKASDFTHNTGFEVFFYGPPDGVPSDVDTAPTLDPNNAVNGAGFTLNATSGPTDTVYVYYKLDVDGDGLYTTLEEDEDSIDLFGWIKVEGLAPNEKNENAVFIGSQEALEKYEELTSYSTITSETVDVSFEAISIEFYFAGDDDVPYGDDGDEVDDEPSVDDLLKNEKVRFDEFVFIDAADQDPIEIGFDVDAIDGDQDPDGPESVTIQLNPEGIV